MAIQLTEEQFKIASENLKMRYRTKIITRSVLVEGMKQSDVCKEMNLTRGTVSLAVCRVLREHQRLNPNGERLSLSKREAARLKSKKEKEKVLTEEQFRLAVSGLSMTPRTLMVAKAVLVDGRSRKDMMEAEKMSASNISMAVKLIWEQHRSLTLNGEVVTAILPPHQAFVVKKWAAEFAAKMENKE